MFVSFGAIGYPNESYGNVADGKSFNENSTVFGFIFSSTMGPVFVKTGV